MELKLIALFLLIHVSLGEAWVNDYDAPVDFTCDDNSFISRIVSQHANKFEDRQWDYTCRNTPDGVTFSDCHWYDDVNKLDTLVSFCCNNNGVVTGVKSVHADYEEDRIFSFKCCEASMDFKSCEQTDYINDFDEYIDYNLPANFAMTGFYSFHQNYEEDRRWKVNICEFPE